MRWNCSRGTHREGGLEFSQAYRSIPDGHRTNGKTGTLGIPVRDASYDESGSSIPGRLLSSRACFRFLDLLNVPKTPPQSVTDVVRTLCNACHETKQVYSCRKALKNQILAPQAPRLLGRNAAERGTPTKHYDHYTAARPDTRSTDLLRHDTGGPSRGTVDAHE